MGPHGEDSETVDLAQSLRLTAVALVSAAVTATLVIGIGGALLDRGAPTQTPDAAASDLLVRTSG